MKQLFPWGGGHAVVPDGEYLFPEDDVDEGNFSLKLVVSEETLKDIQRGLPGDIMIEIYDLQEDEPSIVFSGALTFDQKKAMMKVITFWSWHVFFCFQENLRMFIHPKN